MRRKVKAQLVVPVDRVEGCRPLPVGVDPTPTRVGDAC
jgi:hypothetical protein